MGRWCTPSSGPPRRRCGRGGLGRGRRDDRRRVARGRRCGRCGGHRFGRPHRPAQRNRQPDQHRGLARLSAARPGRGRGAGRAGTARRRRRVHGAGRALAWRGSGCALPAGHGGVHRRGRRTGARRRPLHRPHRQRRPRRARGGRGRRPALRVRRPRLRRDRRVRTVDGALGAGQRLVRAARRRRQGAGRRGGGRGCRWRAGHFAEAPPRSRR